MVIVMQEGATDAQIQNVIDKLIAHGFDAVSYTHLTLPTKA